MKKLIGLFKQLSTEQQKAALEYDGLVASGDPSLPRIKASVSPLASNEKKG